MEYTHRLVRLRSHPPSEHNDDVISQFRLSPGEQLTIGPVHRIDYTNQFVAVQVPWPWPYSPADPPLLVWMNIWTPQNNAKRWVGVHWATPIRPGTVAGWVARGWEVRFYD